MSSEPYRVIQWAPGQVGIHALRGIIEHPGLELVGVWVHSDGKAGRDAGDLFDAKPVGIVTTQDRDGLLALEADCVCYTASDVARLEDVIEDLCAILRSGKNVVSTSLTQLVFPFTVPELLAKLEDACQAGGVSLLTTGVHPGFMLDALPLALSSGTQSVRSITLTETIDCSSYLDPRVLQGLGFGQTLEEAAQVPRAELLTAYWSPAMRLLARGLGVELDELRPYWNVAVTEKAVEIPALYVEADTIAGIYCGFEGIVGGEVRIRLEECLRLGTDVGPKDWPQPPASGGGYRITIEGRPTIRVDVSLETPGIDPLTDAFIVTAMRAVNSIPAVCQAPPGVHTALSLGSAVAGTLAPAAE